MVVLQAADNEEPPLRIGVERGGDAPVGGKIRSIERNKNMSGKTDIVKGRFEEAAGALTNNAQLRNKGQTDQAVGQFKEAVKEVADKIAKLVRR